MPRSPWGHWVHQALHRICPNLPTSHPDIEPVTSHCRASSLGSGCCCPCPLQSHLSTSQRLFPTTTTRLGPAPRLSDPNPIPVPVLSASQLFLSSPMTLQAWAVGPSGTYATPLTRGLRCHPVQNCESLPRLPLLPSWPSFLCSICHH